MELPKLIKDILEYWVEEKQRYLAEDFESFEQMKVESEEYDTLKEINEVREVLGEPSLTYEDFKDDYKTN